MAFGKNSINSNYLDNSITEHSMWGLDFRRWAELFSKIDFAMANIYSRRKKYFIDAFGYLNVLFINFREYIKKQNGLDKVEILLEDISELMEDVYIGKDYDDNLPKKLKELYILIIYYKELSGLGAKLKKSITKNQKLDSAMDN